MSDLLLNSFNTLSHGLIGYIIPFLFVLTIVVFFHELGHFLVAKACGVKCEKFYLGFGPESEIRAHRSETRERDEGVLSGAVTTTVMAGAAFGGEVGDTAVG